jgi:hypothetical protein
MATTPPIPGTKEVLSALGWWPSFHDAEVTRFSLSRGVTADAKTSEAELDVQVREYEPRNAGTAEYELVLIKDVIIRFAFTGSKRFRSKTSTFRMSSTRSSSNQRPKRPGEESGLKSSPSTVLVLHGFAAAQGLQAYPALYRVRPNPSLKRSANGRPPGPAAGYGVHSPAAGPGVLPLSPA